MDIDLSFIGNNIQAAEFKRSLKNLSDLQRGMSIGLCDRLQTINDENARLRLLLAAVLRVLVEKNVVGPSELEQIVTKIDASDGVVDGKLHGILNPDGSFRATPPLTPIKELAEAVEQHEKKK